MNSWVKVLCCSHFTQCIDKLIIDLHTSSMLEDVWGHISSQGRCTLIVQKKNTEHSDCRNLQYRETHCAYLHKYITQTQNIANMFTLFNATLHLFLLQMHTHTPCTYPFAYVCLYIPLYTRHVQYYLLCTWHSHTHTYTPHMFHIPSISLSYILQTCPWPWSNILGNFMFVSCSPVCEYIYIYIHTYLDSPWAA